MSTELQEIDKLEKQLAALKKDAEAREAARVEAMSAGRDDNALLKQCYDLLAYVTYHDGRYGQADNFDRFQYPAQSLVRVLAKRLGIKHD